MTYVQSPRNPLVIFPILILYTQNQLLVHHLIKQTLPNPYNSFLHQEDNNSCTPPLYTKKLFLYNSSLWMIIMYPISLKTSMWSWTRSLIGELSEFFTREEMKVETSFLKNIIFNRVLDRKLMIWIGIIHPRIMIEVRSAHKNTEFQNFRIKSASTQYYRDSKWLCGSWSIRRDERWKLFSKISFRLQSMVKVLL